MDLGLRKAFALSQQSHDLERQAPAAAQLPLKTLAISRLTLLEVQVYLGLSDVLWIPG